MPDGALMPTCSLGHVLVAGECIACRKAAKAKKSKDRKRERERSRRRRADAKQREHERRVAEDPDGSACGIHRNTGPVCHVCEAHRVWLAKTLAATKPFYLVLREREAARKASTGRGDRMHEFFLRQSGASNAEDWR